MWIVEYSEKLDCIHVDDLDNVLKRKLEKKEYDFEVIAIFEEQDKAFEYAIKKRDEIGYRTNQVKTSPNLDENNSNEQLVKFFQKERPRGK